MRLSEISCQAFLLCTLAVWRLSHLLACEDGPFDLVVRLRKRAGNGFFGGLMDCVYCLSVWTAAPFAWLISNDVVTGVVVWLALSGAASLLFKVTGGDKT